MTRPIPGVHSPVRLERAWRQVAEERDGRFGRTAGWGYPVLEVPVGPTHVIVELTHTEQGSRTRARMPFHKPKSFALGVSEEFWLSSLFKSLGLVQDVIVGHEKFDRRFICKGLPVDRVREVLADPVPDMLLRLPVVYLRVLGRGLAPFRLPKDVVLIELSYPGVVTDPQHLSTWIDVLEILQPRLDPLSGLSTTDVDQLVQRLVRSGGDVMDPVTGVVRWDLDPPRIEAARQLAEQGDPEAVPALISVLDDPDDALVIEAIQALETLGNARCVPAMIRLLSLRKPVADGLSIADHAAGALRSLDYGDLVDAWDATFDGEPESLPGVVGDLRTQVIAALMAITDSFDLAARIEAARALGVLGAREALPLLRDKTRSMGMKTKFAAAAHEAVRAIEAQANLPRPAGPAGSAGSDSRDTLPRPAQADPKADSSKLPRSAKGDEAD